MSVTKLLKVSQEYRTETMVVPDAAYVRNDEVYTDWDNGYRYLLLVLYFTVLERKKTRELQVCRRKNSGKT